MLLLLTTPLESKVVLCLQDFKWRIPNPTKLSGISLYIEGPRQWEKELNLIKPLWVYRMHRGPVCKFRAPARGNKAPGVSNFKRNTVYCSANPINIQETVGRCSR